MKYYIFILLSIAFTAQIAALSGWQSNLQERHWYQIEFIVKNVHEQIERVANASGTAGAQRCFEDAKEQLASVKSTGRDDVKWGIQASNEERHGEEYCRGIDRKVFNESLLIYKAALECTNRDLQSNHCDPCNCVATQL